jgi:hypothetical protein
LLFAAALVVCSSSWLLPLLLRLEHLLAYCCRPCGVLWCWQSMLQILPSWYTWSERSFAWSMLWIACFVCVVILALQIVDTLHPIPIPDYC